MWMDFSVVYGFVVAVVMLGVPLRYSILECKRGRVAKIRLLRWWLTCVLLILFTFISAILCGIAGVFLADLSVTKPSSVSTECRILANSVDLRSAKVCELGLFNYKAKNVVQPAGRSGYRCHYDYYWASVFKVEYSLHASIKPIQAAAEAPKEALPLNCRPTFNSAWRTKDKFKVNGTYHCKFTPGKSKVDIVGDNFFNCIAKVPSKFELIRRVAILFWQSDRSIYSKKSHPVRAFWKAVASISVGISYSIFVTGFAKIIRELRTMLFGSADSSEVDAALFEARLQLMCIFIASLFAITWLGGQHDKFSHLCQFLVKTHLEGSRKWWGNLQKAFRAS